MLKRSLFVLSLLPFVFTWSAAIRAQGMRQVKVVVNFQQTGNQRREAVIGSGSIVITRRGGVHPSGRLSAGSRQSTVKRSTGIFTIVQDGGESILNVATKVPYREVTFYRDYATGAGYITKRVVFREAGTSLRVSATILPGGQVNVRLTPRISYFSPDGSGAIDFTEATTELVVPSGQPVSLGGTTTQMHEVTRRIFGFADRTTTSETSILLTATIQ